MIPLDFKYVTTDAKTYDKFTDCYEDISNGKTSVSADVKSAYDKIGDDPSFQTGI